MRFTGPDVTWLTKFRVERMPLSDELSAQRAREALRDHTSRVATSSRAAGPDAPVPTAAGWNVAALVEHLGQTQHWVSELLERRVTDPTQLPTEMAVMPSDAASWSDWLGESAERAAAAASDAALAAPVWNAAGDQRTGGQFWLDSLLNEAVVHGFDAAAAAAGSAAAAADRYLVDADVASELVTNHLAMLTSPTWAAQRADSADALRGTGQTLLWRATDASSSAGSVWFIERRPGGAVFDRREAAADVTVSGPAGLLLLMLTRRIDPDGGRGGVTIDGDIDLVRHWVQHTAHVAG